MFDELVARITGPGFIRIFLPAFILYISTLACRYIVKMKDIEPSSSAPRQVRQAVHFDCLRTGADLALIGLVALLGVLQIAIERVSEIDTQELLVTQNLAIMTEVALLLCALVLTRLFDSPDKTRWRGLILPNLLGWIAIILSVGVFEILVNPGESGG